MKAKKGVFVLACALVLVMGMVPLFAGGVQEKEAEKGFTLAIKSEVASLLPYKVRNPEDRIIASIIYEQLLQFDENGTPQPYLAKSIKEDPKLKTYTIVLREGILFQDGTELTAEVAKWNLDMYKEKGVLSSSFLSQLESVEVTGDYTVVLHLSSWDSLLPYAIARQVGYMVSKEAYEANGEEYFKEHPVGTGPFMLESWDHDVGMKFVKFKDYWQGEPRIDYMETAIYSTELVARAAMEDGEIQAMVTDDFDTAKYLAAKGFTVNVSSVPYSAYTICYNMTDAGQPFHNVKVRRAVSSAINTEQIANALGKGYGKVSNQWALPGGAFYDKNLVGYPYDVERAKALLAEAGYANGFDTTLTLLNWPILVDLGQIIKEQLAVIGVNVELNIVDPGNYPNFIGTWPGGMLIHPMGMENGAASQIAANFVQGLNFALGVQAFLHPDDLNQLIRKAQSSDRQTAVALFNKAQAMIIEDYTMMKVVMIVPAMVVTSPSLHDTGFAKTTLYSTTLGKAWLE